MPHSINLVVRSSGLGSDEFKNPVEVNGKQGLIEKEKIKRGINVVILTETGELSNFKNFDTYGEDFGSGFGTRREHVRAEIDSFCKFIDDNNKDEGIVIITAYDTITCFDKQGFDVEIAKAYEDAIDKIRSLGSTKGDLFLCFRCPWILISHGKNLVYEELGSRESGILIKKELTVTDRYMESHDQRVQIAEITLADKDSQIKKENAIDYHNRGDFYREQGEYEKALADYDEAIKEDPTNAWSFNNRGLVKAKLGRHKEAISDYDNAIKLNHLIAQYFVNRGISAEKIDPDVSVKVAQDYAQAIALDNLEEEDNSEKSEMLATVRLLNAINKKSSIRVLKALEDGANINRADLNLPGGRFPTETKLNALEFAAAVGFEKGFVYLYEQEQTEKHPKKLLKLAAKFGQDSIVEWLIKKTLPDSDSMEEAAKEAEKNQYKRLASYIRNQNKYIPRVSRWINHDNNRELTKGVIGYIGGILTPLMPRIIGWIAHRIGMPVAAASELSAAQYFLYESIWLDTNSPENITTSTDYETLPFLVDSKPDLLVDSLDKEQKTSLPKSKISSSFNQSLSTNDYLGVVVPYIAHYARQYSPWTLPWNREKKLSEKDRQQLNTTLKKRKHLESNFSSQQNSRAAGYDFLTDKFAFIEKELRNLKSDIGSLLEKGKASSSHLSEVQSKLDRIEEVMQQLSVNNKKLRRFEAREKRLSKRSQQTGKQASTILHYNVTKNCLRQEVVYDHSPRLMPAKSVLLKIKEETSSNTGSYRFSQSQQFWGQPTTSSLPMARITQGNQSKIEATQSRAPKHQCITHQQSTS